MLKYILKRLLLIIPVTIGAIVVVFTINFFSTTSPAEIKLGSAALDEELLAQTVHEMGLDRPYLVQLGDYLLNLVQGDFGTSYIYERSVMDLMSSRIPNSLKIGISSVILAVLVGVPLGLAAALHQNTAIDYGTTTIAVLLHSMPGFLLAVLLMLIFAVKLRWLPVAGLDTWKGYILPIIAASAGPVTQNARMTRSAVLEVIRQDYVRMAHAKGIDERKVITRHVLRNALIPIITTIGTSLGHAISGSMLVEKVFNVPGMGTLISSSVNNKDFITVQGCVVVCALVVTAMNLLTDLAYAAVDPRIRAQYSSGGTKKKKQPKRNEGGNP